MKKLTALFKIACLCIFLSNCSSDKEEIIYPNAPVITTAAVSNINGMEVTLNGKITSSGDYAINQYGFCVSTFANPTTSDFSYALGGTGLGDFSTIVTIEKPSTLYHVRAYVATSSGIFYGEDVTFTSQFPLTSQPVVDILTKSAVFKGTIVSVPSNSQSMGYCYSTSPNPTTANSIAEVSTQLGIFSRQIQYLTPNTTYYVRSYYAMYGETFYGPEMTFKTVGYSGPAGGYVAYDKGFVSDGWRYFEVFPETINYNVSQSGYGSRWGCVGTLISNTYPEIGAGATNTQIIASACGQANSAATLCSNFSRNGFTDWFLGSRDEMLAVYKSMKAIGIPFESCWSSTEIVSNSAYMVYYSQYSNPEYVSTSTNKNDYYNVYPIRRY